MKIPEKHQGKPPVSNRFDSVRHKWMQNPEYTKWYYWHHKDRCNELARKYYKEHAEERRQNSLVRSKKWVGENREKARANNRNHIARTKWNGGEHTAEDIQKIFEYQEGKCYYCKSKLYERWDLDHKQPVSKGGSNCPANLCCACIYCNRSKCDKTEGEFFKYIKGAA